MTDCCIGVTEKNGDPNGEVTAGSMSTSTCGPRSKPKVGWEPIRGVYGHIKEHCVIEAERRGPAAVGNVITRNPNLLFEFTGPTELNVSPYEIGGSGGGAEKKSKATKDGRMTASWSKKPKEAKSHDATVPPRF